MMKIIALTKNGKEVLLSIVDEFMLDWITKRLKENIESTKP
jgi:hypothetical protein